MDNTREKLIDADALLLALCDDHNINGANFTRVKNDQQNHSRKAVVFVCAENLPCLRG